MALGWDAAINLQKISKEYVIPTPRRNICIPITFQLFEYKLGGKKTKVTDAVFMAW